MASKKKTPAATKTTTASGAQPQRIGALPGEPPDVEPSAPATKAEAEALIRSITRTCQGPTHEPSQREWRALMDEGRVDEARGLRTRGTAHPDGYLVPCGYDFNETILKYPFDGAEHTDTCPKCGTTTSWRSPVIALS